MSRGLGRRIHGSVEDTKLSTNKQHTLSLKLHKPMPPPCALSPATHLPIPTERFKLIYRRRRRISLKRVKLPPPIDCDIGGAFYYLGSECDHLPEAGNNYLGSECDHLPEAGNNYLGSECDHQPEAGNIIGSSEAYNRGRWKESRVSCPSPSCFAPPSLVAHP
jgi:hypothetical protein